MVSIAFSRDRAMQLEALLRSCEDHVTPAMPIDVIYLASTPRHEAAYREAFALHPSARQHAQAKPFKRELLDLVPADGNVAFFVDDQVFVRPWTVDERPGLSLRLGLHLTRNYNSNDAPQAVPPHKVIPSNGRSADDDLIAWRWADGELAWRYPLSVDGHVYDAHVMRSMIDALEFSSPNTFEAGLQSFAAQFLPTYGTCYRKSKVVNVPWNQVQTDWKNRSDGVWSADALLAQWERGRRIDVWQLYGVENRSVHQVLPLDLEPRT